MGTGASVLEEVHGSEDYYADELVHIRGDDSQTYQCPFTAPGRLAWPFLRGLGA
jgi:hypothetical protein